MNKPVLAAVGAVVLALSAACTESTPAPAPTAAQSVPTTPAAFTLQDMCNALSSFFANDLMVQDLRIKADDDLGKVIYGSGGCSVEANSEMVAYASIAFVGNPSTTWNPTPMMKPISGTSEPTWIFDGRPYGLIDIITRNNEREGVIQISEDHARTPSGRLALTDEQLLRVAEFCIGLTRHLRQ
ncbi:hypothetical protein ACW2Q0_25220 [Nocardia sp. R16R-3T]